MRHRMFFCWNISLALFGAISIRSEIDFTQIKGLYSLLQSKQHLSPLHGFIWWKSNYIEKLYRYGNPHDDTIAVIQELFFLNPWDEWTFDCTVVPYKPATYFTPRTIGCIMNALEAHADDAPQLEDSLTKAVKQDLQYDALCERSQQDQAQLQKRYDAELNEKKLRGVQWEKEKQTIAHKKKNIAITKKEMEQKLNQLRQQRNALKKKRPVTPELVEQRACKENEIEQMHGKLGNLNAELTQVNAAGKNLNQQLQQNGIAIRKIESEIKNSALQPDALHKLVALMCGALRESQEKYVPNTAQNILLAFLWKKAASKHDFIDYFSAALPSTALNEPRILQENSAEQKQWLHEHYALHSHGDVAQVLSKITEHAKNEDTVDTFVTKQYEELTAALYAYNIFSSSFPPQAIPGWATYKQYRFADCGSTALRNFLDTILYDEKAGSFDLSRVANAGTVHPKLKYFYKEHGAIENVQSQSARDAWVAVTSSLHNEDDDTSDRIDYKTPPENGMCEIAARSGIANMMRILHKLLGVKSIGDALDKLREKTQKKITGDFKPAAESSNFGVFSMAIDKKKFAWHFEPFHSHLIIEPQYHTTNESVDDFMCATVQQVERNPESSYLQHVCSLYRDKEKMREGLLEYVARNPTLKRYITLWCLMLFDLARDQEKIALFHAILHSDTLRVIPELVSLLERIHNGFFENKPTYYNGIIDAILSSGVYKREGYEYQQHFLKVAQQSVAKIRNKFPKAISELIDSIHTHEATMFYGVTEDD